MVGITKKTNTLAELHQPKNEVVKEQRPAPTDDEGAFHIVGKGETLRHICDVYGLDFAKVAQINKVNPPYAISEGDTVFLPAQALLADADPVSGKRELASGDCSARSTSRHAVANAIRGKRDPSVPKLKFPVPQGTLTSPFGYRWGRFHKGVDIAAAIGNPVLACANGRVIFVGSRKRFRRYGNTVLVDHGKGVYTYYAHLNEILVKKGQAVRSGQRIARVGNTGRSTGPHLHLEVRVANKMYNPMAYFPPQELAGTRLASKRFNHAPMGPVRARWGISDLLTASR